MTIFNPETFEAIDETGRVLNRIESDGTFVLVPLPEIKVGDTVLIDSYRPFCTGGEAVVTEVTSSEIRCGRSRYDRFNGCSIPESVYYISHKI